MPFRLLFQLWLLIIVPWPIIGQVMHFDVPFTTEDIPQIPTRLHQDQQGFIWIGTTDGLYRYDGREIREFRKMPQDTFSLPNNYIRSITEDAVGNLWIGTNGGIARYSTLSERFVRITNPTVPQVQILDLMVDHKGVLWISTYNGLFQYNSSEESVRNFLPDPEQKGSSLSSKTVWSTFEDSQHRIWVATHLGFTVFKNDDQYQLRAYFGDWKKTEGLTTDRVFRITEQPEGAIWMATHDGVFRLTEHLDSFAFNRFHKEGPTGQKMSYNFVDDIVPFGSNKLWAATYRGGVNEFTLGDSLGQNTSVKHHRPSALLPGSLGSEEVKTILPDDQNLLWIATNRRVEVGERFRENFETVGAINEDGYGLESLVCKVPYVDSYGNLWVGHNKGLSYLSAADRLAGNYRFRYFVHDDKNPNSISDNNIANITEDSQGNLWVMTQKGGLNYTELKHFSKHEKFELLNKKGLKDYNLISDVVEYAAGEYYVASDHGFAHMTFSDRDPQTFKAAYFEMSDRIENAQGLDPGIVNSTSKGIEQDRFGDYWVGTFSGVARVRIVDGETLFENYVSEPAIPGSLSNNSFRCFFLDSKGRLWIGTRSGLNLVLQEDQVTRAQFRIYGSEDGLPNDVIHAIEEDGNGHLWISTNRGLVQFNPDVEPGRSPVLKIYSQADGLPGNNFIYRAAARSEEGMMYFGTASGLAVFHPDSMLKNERPPALRFTKLSILNEEVKPSSKSDSPLAESMVTVKEITLRHWQNIVTLHFAALNFRQPERNEYQYRFSALGDGWLNIGTQNHVTFTNIPSGTHTLEVKGSNNDGVWQETPLQLKVRMLPPPWRTWWAYLLYAVSLLALLYFAFRYRLDRRVAEIRARTAVEQAKLETRRQVRERNAADFHDELGHRLTKIMLFTELAERENKVPSVKKHLQKIRGDAKGLSSGIRDLIWSLDTQQDSLFATSLRLQEFGDRLFEGSSIILEITGINEAMNDIPMAPDTRKHCLLLFKEAMNNCLKYSQAKKAQLSFTCPPGQIIIGLADDGVGFSTNREGRGYGLKNMQQRADKIGAELKIVASEGEGTEISLRLNTP